MKTRLVSGQKCTCNSKLGQQKKAGYYVLSFDVISVIYPKNIEDTDEGAEICTGKSCFNVDTKVHISTKDTG